jgi:hypothetical protein
VADFRQALAAFGGVFLREDICRSHGPLILPAPIRKLIFPCCKAFLSNIKSRQLDPGRSLCFQTDTDGRAEDVISLSQELGVDAMGSLEAALGRDVVLITQYMPAVKRILAQGKDARDEMVG